jgi:hypothetical protein
MPTMENERDKNPDDQLLGELRRIATDLDAVPEDVTGFAKAALGWRRIDAELAELLADSAIEQEALAQTRSRLAQTREVTFRASGLEIDLEIQQVAPGLLLLGQLDPPVSASVEVQRDDGSVAAATDADDLGRFRIELPAPARIRLRITQPALAQLVETSWLSL